MILNAVADIIAGNMETHVHQFIAQDIAKTVQAFFGNATVTV